MECTTVSKNFSKIENKKKIKKSKAKTIRIMRIMITS